jgi:O-antigen ligase
MRRERLIAAPALSWVLAFVLASTISTIASSDPELAATQLETYYLEGVVLFFLATNVMRSSKIVRSVIWTIVLAGALLASFSVYQQFTGDFGNQFGGFAQVSSTTEGFTVEEEGLTASSQKRLGGPFSGGGANRYAQILLVLVPLAVFLVWTAKHLRARLLAAVSLLFLTFGVVLTFSRGAAIAFAAVVVLMAALRFLRLRHLAMIGVIVAIVLVSVPSYWIRVSSLVELPGVTSTGSNADSSIQSRGTENLAAILIFADHPAFGVGPGMYPQYYEDYQDRVGDYSDVIDINQKYTTRQAHNLYLGVLAETGIIGFVCLMGAIGVTLLELWRARRRCLRDGRMDIALLPTAVILALAAYLITALFLHLAYERYFFLLLALGAAAAAVTLRDLAESQEESPAAPRPAPAARAVGT